MTRQGTSSRSSGTGMREDVSIVLGLALAPAIGLGIARFAYALVLPNMRADLGWSYADAGWMNSTNAVGYLLGALLASHAIAAWGGRAVMLGGVHGCIMGLALCAITRYSPALNAGRFVAGLGGGLSFVAGGVLATGIAQRHPARASFLLGLFYGGPGFGILLSGLSVPFLLQRLGPGSWSMAWAMLAVFCLPLAATLHRTRDGTAPAGTGERMPAPYRDMAWLLAGYLIFGAGYIAYMTFMIAWVQGSGSGAALQALFWLTIGVAAMASPWIWGPVLKRQRHGRAFALLTVLTTVGAALPLLSSAVPVLLASGALFGSAFFAVVAATTVFARRNLPPAAWASSIGALTVAFGIGQMLGPEAIGVLNDLTQGLSGGLWASTGSLFLAALVGWRQRDLVHHDGA